MLRARGRRTARALALGLIVVAQARPQPAISSVVNAASFAPLTAPGTLATVFGTGLAPAAAAAATVPLPRQLAGTAVLIRDPSRDLSLAAPLLFVSPGQINFQVPFEFGAAPVEITVSNGAGVSPPFPMRLSTVAPGIFSKDGTGQGEVLLFDSAFNPLAAVVPGTPFIFYATGLGGTEPMAVTGEGGLAAPPLETIAVPLRVHVGGATATVDWAGLAPGLPGVFQLKVTAPWLAGPELYLELTDAGRTVLSNVLRLPGSSDGTLQNLQVIGTTATQAAISYTAPSTGAACTLQVSETNEFSSSSYTPVNDVNPQLFPGSALDTRPGSLRSGADRVVVIGKRAAEKSGSLFYSRALQADTPHYFRIGCGAAVATGAFRTSNIPVGNTWEDPLPADPDTPGGYAWPALDTSSRDNFVIDPDTGVKLQVFTRPGDIDGETGNNTLTQVAGAGCANKPVATSDGKVGYHCKIKSSLYWVEQGGASSRLLGPSVYSANPSEGRTTWANCRGFPFSSSDPNVLYCLYAGDEQHVYVVKGVYNGHTLREDTDTYAAPTRLDPPLATWSNITPAARSLRTLVEEFEPAFASFVPAFTYLWLPIGVQDDKLIIDVTLVQQDTIGWQIVFDPLKTGAAPGCVGRDPAYVGRPGCVVATHSTYGGGPNTPNRWCTDHGLGIGQTLGPWISPAANLLMLNRNGGGPYTLDVIAVDGAPGAAMSATGGACPQRPADSPIPPSEWPSSGCTQLTLIPMAEPVSAYPPASLGPLIAGDLAGYALDWRPGNTSELGRVLLRTGDTIWVQRGYRGSPKFKVNAPFHLYMVCNSYGLDNARGLWWWNFAEDPHGVRTYYNTTGIGGHRDIGFLPFRTLHVGVGPDYQYGVNTKPLPDALSEPAADLYSITFFPQFASTQLYRGGTANLESHLRYVQAPDTELETRWVADARPYFGDTLTVKKTNVT
ncbi:MAG: hypothetical protein ABSD56_04370, partial [Bryobacteraceae bacterium]